MVAAHFFHKLVFSARLHMKMALWGFCVLVFDCPGEPASRPEEMICRGPYSSGTEFLVGASTGAPMEIPSSL